ncbi:MAG: phosphopentomutase [Candidatus Gastranaerophilales bacterium]|nr:phosphopentomutase [Candidatus Gastranaerophilales bacterium]MCM1073008.1 phosphopentomutase [Bacteroides sp.]
MSKKRAVIIVIDSMGIGAMPDCNEFGDTEQCNTLRNVCAFNKGLDVPVLEALGLGNIQDFEGIEKTSTPMGQYGTLQEKSKGKDTTTGHWEIAGLVSEKPFATFPQGFPQELLDKFIAETNCGGILANIPASGTAIIEQLNDEHHATKYPIVYTSADSVYQIAVDTDLIPLETLYSWCETARRLLDEGSYNVARVIARPYKVIDGKPTRISKDRRDYSMVPPKETVLDRVKSKGAKVIGIGKIEDIFSKKGITHAIHTGSNKEGLELTLKALKEELPLAEMKYEGVNITDEDREIIFTNLVDTDMLFGHRNNAEGYGKAIEEIDDYLEEILPLISEDDLLIITADHGCDPTVEGTDHTREYVPVLYYSKGIEPKDLGLTLGFDSIAKRIENWLF